MGARPHYRPPPLLHCLAGSLQSPAVNASAVPPRCAQCFRDLDGEVYFRFDDRIYCLHDFERLYAPICQRCKSPVLNGHVIKAATGSYHAECFSCDGCLRDLDEGVWVSDGLILCFDCKHIIEPDELLKLHHDCYHAYHFECTTCEQTLTSTGRRLNEKWYCERCYDLQCPSCYECKRAIDPDQERSVAAMGHHYHVEHFRCARCLVPFHGKPFFVNRELPYCQKDYIENFGERCFVCSRGLTGESVRIFNKGWCKECYACHCCHRRLKPKDKVLEENMQPVCKKCMERKMFQTMLKERQKRIAEEEKRKT
ncbi:unnamed protein product, partial [Mesorhabditis spiculigera]